MLSTKIKQNKSLERKNFTRAFNANLVINLSKFIRSLKK